MFTITKGGQNPTIRERRFYFEMESFSEESKRVEFAYKIRFRSDESNVLSDEDGIDFKLRIPSGFCTIAN